MKNTLKTSLGSFQKIAKLGSGSFGEVWHALAIEKNKPVALKFLKVSNERILEQFKFEFEILTQLHHKNLCEVYGFGKTKSGDHFFATELCSGQPFLQTAQNLMHDEFLEIVSQTLIALQAIHSQDIVHFDLKSENILIQKTPDGYLVKLIDFGVAKNSHTENEELLGTPAYMSPEMIQRSTVDHRADLYSLGILCYKALTGKWPFSIQSAKKVLQWHKSGVLDLNPLHSAQVPQPFIDLIEKLLEKKPTNRFSSAQTALNFLNVSFGKNYLAKNVDFSHLIIEEGKLVGRNEIIKIIKTDLDNWNSKKYFTRISGKPGYGKTRILKEIRFLVETQDAVILENKIPSIDKVLKLAEKNKVCLLLDSESLSRSTIKNSINSLKHRLEMEFTAIPLKVFICDTSKEKGDLILNKLSQDDVYEYIHSLIGDHKKLNQFAEKVYENSSGIPLQMIRALQSLFQSKNSEKTFQKTLNNIKENDRLILEILSCFDKPIQTDLVQKIYEKEFSNFSKTLFDLKRNDLVKDHYEKVSLQSFLLKEEVHEDFVKRHQIENEIALYLEEHSPQRLLEIAKHFEAAQNKEKSASYYTQAAKYYELQNHVYLAADCFQKAAELQDYNKNLVIKACHFLLQSGLPNDALEFLENTRLEDDADLLTIKGLIYFKQRELVQSQTCFESALKDSKINKNEKLTIQNHLANTLLHLGQSDSAFALWQGSLADEENQIIPNNNLGLALCLKGKHQEALEFYQNRLQKLKKDQVVDAIRYQSYLGYILLQSDQFELAILSLQKALTLVEKHKYYNDIFSILGNLYSAYSKAYDYYHCLKFLEKMTDYQIRFGNKQDLAFNLLRQAQTSLTLGLLPAADKCLEKGLSFAESLNDFSLIGYFHLMESILLTEKESYEDAISKGETGLEYAKKSSDTSLEKWCVFSKAQTRFYQKQSDEALKLLKEIELDKSDIEFYLRVKLVTNKISKNPKELQELSHLANKNGFTEISAEISALQGDFASAQETLLQIAEKLPEEYKVSYLNTQDRKSIFQKTSSNQENKMNQENTYKVLLEINKRLTSERDTDRLLELIMDSAIELSGADEGLLLIQNEYNNFDSRVARNVQKKDVKTIDYSKSIATQVAQTKKPIFSENAIEDEDLNVFESVLSTNLKSIICAPLKNHGKVIGVIYLSSTTSSSQINEDFLPVLEMFADQASIALQNATLLEQQRDDNEELQKDLFDTRRELENKENQLVNLANQLSKRPRNTLYSYDKIIGRSKAIEDVLKTLDKVTNAFVPVFIHGETGTGKELIARALHDNSSRRDQPFIAINCSAFTESILESELFGYKKGSFTGADRDRKGLFEQAHEGTLFLDEIGDMSPSMQAKILRVIQEQEVMPVGGRTSVKIKVRIVSASHKNLKKMVKEGAFREDLFFRLAGITVSLPALKQRKEDIPLLVDYFIKKIVKENHISKKPKLSQAAKQKLINYSWPGNIRELEQSLTSALLLAEGNEVSENDIILQESSQSAASSPNLPSEYISFDPEKEFDDYEKEILIKTYEHYENNKSLTAKKLGISRLTLHKKLQSYEE